MKKIIFTLVLLSFFSCKKGYLGVTGYLLSPARDVTGTWEGTLTSSWNVASNSNIATSSMTLVLVANGNNITGTMTAFGSTGSITGTINGAKIEFQTYIGSGMAADCIDVHGTFTSTNMDGMKGSKGIEWHLQKK